MSDTVNGTKDTVDVLRLTVLSYITMHAHVIIYSCPVVPVLVDVYIILRNISCFLNISVPFYNFCLVGH